MDEAKIESMLTQLIKMVGTMREEQLGMKEEMTSMKEEQTSMRTEMTSMKEEQTSMRTELTSMKEDLKRFQTLSETRHKEIMDRFTVLEADLELTWEKTARNEREIGKFKKFLEL